MVNEVFLAHFRSWIGELREIASRRPGTGACALATAMQTWLWTAEHLQVAKDAEGDTLYHSNRQGVTFPLADALCWLIAARCFIQDLLELEEKGPANPVGGGSAARHPAISHGPVPYPDCACGGRIRKDLRGTGVRL
jgi:hypothetical protein